MIISIASTTGDAGSSAMSPGPKIELLRVFRKQAINIMMDFNRRANLVPYCLRRGAYGFAVMRFCGNFYFNSRYCGFKTLSGLRLLQPFSRGFR